MNSEWSHGLFGCFDNLGLCIVTYFAPCYTAGKVAETIDKNCLLWGILLVVPIVGLVTLYLSRKGIREKQGIEASALNDFCTVCWCGCCALIQEGREMGIMDGGMAQDIDRE